MVVLIFVFENNFSVTTTVSLVAEKGQQNNGLTIKTINVSAGIRIEYVA